MSRLTLDSSENLAIVADSKEMQVEIYDNFEDLETIQGEWDQFVESIGGEIFLTFDWCRIWWKYYGKNRDLRLFIFRNDDKLVGIIPLFFEKIWLGPVFVRAAKIVGSDFTLSQFSIPLAKKYMKEIIKKLSELLSEEKWDILHIGPVAGLYGHYDGLKNACKKLFTNRYIVLSKQKGVQTYFKLADNWEEHLSTMSKNEKGNIRRNYNSIRRKCTELLSCLDARFATEEEFTEFFDDFVNMHQLHWNELGKAGHFKDWPHAYEFHRDLAKTQLQAGRLRLLKVTLGNDCFGYQYHYRFGDKYFHLLDSRPEQNPLESVSPGRITFCEQTKKAIQEKICCIDSMRGYYEHKLRLGGTLFPLRSLCIIQNKLFTLIRVYTFRVLAWCLNLCYYRIWFQRIAPKLPLKRRPLWRIWIRTEVFS